MREHFEVADYLYSTFQSSIDQELTFHFEAVNPRWPSPRQEFDELLVSHLVETLSQFLSHVDITVNATLESHTHFGKIQLSVKRQGFINPGSQMELLFVFKETINDMMNQGAAYRWQEGEIRCETGKAYSARFIGANTQAKFHLELPSETSRDECNEFLTTVQWTGPALTASARKPSGQFLLTGELTDFTEGWMYYEHFINRATAAHFSQLA